jgi:hypothetical protein
MKEITVPKQGPPSVGSNDDNGANEYGADNGPVRGDYRLGHDATLSYDDTIQTAQHFTASDWEGYMSGIFEDNGEVNRMESEDFAYDNTAPQSQYPPASDAQSDSVHHKDPSNTVGFGTVEVEKPGFATSESGATNNIMQMTSGTGSVYGTAQSGSKTDGQSVVKYDTESIVTDGSQAPIQRENKTRLEKAFAREVSSRFTTLMQESFASRSDMAADLLYAFSIMIGKRASTTLERGAASFVRRGRR